MNHSFRTYSDGDEAALQELLKKSFGSFKQDNYWVWKYKSNPDFDPDLVVLAEENQQLIGCNHWLPRNLKLSKNIQVRAALAGDVTVDCAYRRQGLGRGLLAHLRSSGAFEKKGILLSFMFTNAGLNRSLYQPAAGYVLLPTHAVAYKKLFTCNKLKEKFQRMNRCCESDEQLKRKFGELNLNVVFRLKGAPKFTVYIDSQGVRLDEQEPQDPNVVIEGYLPLSESIIGESASVGDLFKAWITGKIRIKKGLRHLFKLRRAFKILQATVK
ncbi:MAG: GNAT family N-acetyltransferase [Candidatus Bathyarchaeota archaeon]|nr:GNAT family N-acetyltransferase [Candidatus Bathyarchaeota archaeon]